MKQTKPLFTCSLHHRHDSITRDLPNQPVVRVDQTNDKTLLINQVFAVVMGVVVVEIISICAHSSRHYHKSRETHQKELRLENFSTEDREMSE